MAVILPDVFLLLLLPLLPSVSSRFFSNVRVVFSTFTTLYMVL